MIDKTAAIEIVRKRAREKGWAFAEPVDVVERGGARGAAKLFEIETNVGNLGTKARFVVNAATGEILSEGYIPR